MPIGNPRWLPPQVIVLTQENEMEKLYRGPYIDAYCQVWFHLAKLFQRRRLNLNQRLSRACIVHLVIKKNVSKRVFSENKLPRNDHWKVLCFLCRSEIEDGCQVLP
jgi:hypothetical protein